MDGGASDLGRAAFLGRKTPQRPPWTDEASVRAKCTSCGDCINACPEAILFKGPAGTPVLNFTSGGCTFCGACAEACEAGVFRGLADAPWGHVAALGEGCLLKAGIACQTCTDACDVEALTFDLSDRPVGAVRIEVAACTGCGFCLSACPVSAITITNERRTPQ